MKRVTVAAIQVQSDNGAPDQNLASAEAFVGRAAAGGAELVICPEFLATGYIYDESIWDAAEPRDGRTERWLARMADRHGLAIGASYLERDGERFFNTFSLFGREGLLGRVRKRSLPFFEGWFFTPCAGPKIIESPFGRLAIGICNDNQTSAFYNEVIEARPDLIVMPHSAPTPRVPIVDRIFRPLYEEALSTVAARYAKHFGIPVVMANKVTFHDTTSTVPLWPHPRLSWRFRGHSAIVDAQGRTLEQLVDREGALVAELELDAALRRHHGGPAKGYWSFTPPFFSRTMAFILRRLADEGQRHYEANPRRRPAAERVSPSQPSCAARTR